MNDEVEKLLQKAKRSLKAAENLYKEADFDFAASRAYYAMFYAAEALLLTKSLSFSKHSGVIAGFWEHFVKDGSFPKDLHKSLHDAFNSRNIGDYGYELPFPQTEAKELLDNARRFIEASENYLKDFGPS